jgi:putative ABC transport system permease protein
MPDWKQEITKRLAGLHLVLAREVEIVEELAQHADDRYAELLAGGISEAQARQAVLEEIASDEDLLRELPGAKRTVEHEPSTLLATEKHSILADFWQDLRYGLRMWAKNSAFTLVAVLTLALGIGANASIFTLINGLILRPLPYPHPERLVELAQQFKDGPYYGMSLTQFRYFHRQSHTIQYLAAYDILGSGLSLTTGTEPERVQSTRVSADFFRVLGVPPIMGRNFTADDDRPGTPPVVIFSYRIWKDSFGGDPAALGRSIRMGGENYTVIGIAPPDFLPPREAEAWIPLRTKEDPSDRSSAFKTIARLREGISTATAQEDLNRVMQHWRQEFPDSVEPGQVGTSMVSYQKRLVGDVRPALLLLSVAVACVLLIACSNVASLLLVRAVSRRKEIAIRTALGISRARLIRQLLTESTLLSVAGGFAGLLLSRWGVRFMLVLSSASLPRVPQISIDLRVLVLTTAVSIVIGLLFGAAPAFQLGRLNSAQVLRESSRATASATTRRLQGFLVSLEISLATVLLLGAGLLLTSFAKLLYVDPGFNPKHILTLKTSLVGSAFSSSTRVDAVVRKVSDRLHSIPGVQSVSAATMLPTEPSVQFTFELPGVHGAEGQDSAGAEVQWRAITPTYFQVMQIPRLQGRVFIEGDSPHSAPVALVNHAFLRQFMSGSEAIGQGILLGRQMGPQFSDRPRQIVGVVSDFRETALDESAPPTVFVPLSQVPDALIAFSNRLLPLSWLIRVAGDSLALARPIRNEMHSVDIDLVASNPRSMEDILSTSLARQRLNAALLGFFAASALLLGAIGLFGVMAYSVAERAQEFGVRAALGATPAGVRWLVLRQSAKLAISGLVVGVIAFLGLGRLLSGFLFGVKPSDPGVYAAVVLVLTVVVLLASYLPAHRAMKIDPATILRQ